MTSPSAIFVIIKMSTFQCVRYVFFSDEIPVSRISQARMCEDDFEMVKVIGRGAFGEVQLVSIQR